MPLPTVAATFRWKMNSATKLKSDASATAWCGRSTPVETTVAMEFAASCRPFRKSKASARATRKTSVPKLISTQAFSSEMPSTRFATSRQRSVMDSSSW